MSNKRTENTNNKLTLSKAHNLICFLLQLIDTNLDEYDAKANKLLASNSKSQLLSPYSIPRFNTTYYSVHWFFTDHDGIKHTVKRNKRTNKYDLDNILQADSLEKELFLEYMNKFSCIGLLIEQTNNSCSEDTRQNLLEMFFGKELL